MGADHSHCPLQVSIPLPEEENVLEVMKCCMHDDKYITIIKTAMATMSLTNPIMFLGYIFTDKCMYFQKYYIYAPDGSYLSYDKEEALQKCKDIERKIQESERKREQKTQNDIKAKKVHENGQSAWQDAWHEESQDNDTAATKLFELAKNMFQEASNLDPQNVIYQEAVAMTDCKIEGNKLFNEGLLLQMEGNRLKSMQKYVDANKKFLGAMEKFAEGAQLDKENKERFQECIDIVRESISEIKPIIKSLSTTAKTTVLTDLHYFVKKNREMIGVEESVVNEETNIDVMYAYILDYKV